MGHHVFSKLTGTPPRVTNEVPSLGLILVNLLTSCEYKLDSTAINRNVDLKFNQRIVLGLMLFCHCFTVLFAKSNIYLVEELL